MQGNRLLPTGLTAAWALSLSFFLLFPTLLGIGIIGTLILNMLGLVTWWATLYGIGIAFAAPLLAAPFFFLVLQVKYLRSNERDFHRVVELLGQHELRAARGPGRGNFHGRSIDDAFLGWIGPQQFLFWVMRNDDGTLDFWLEMPGHRPNYADCVLRGIPADAADHPFIALYRRLQTHAVPERSRLTSEQFGPRETYPEIPRS